MTTPGSALRGRHGPGRGSPGMGTRGPTVPKGGSDESVEQTGIAVDSTGQTNIGTVGGDRTTVYEVTVTPDAADFDFNVTVDGETVFENAQSPDAAAEESFDPDGDGEFVVKAGDGDVVFDVSSASATGGATADVSVEARGEESY